jgi:hypothetical protein
MVHLLAFRRSDKINRSTPIKDVDGGGSLTGRYNGFEQNRTDGLRPDQGCALTPLLDPESAGHGALGWIFGASF